MLGVLILFGMVTAAFAGDIIDQDDGDDLQDTGAPEPRGAGPLASDYRSGDAGGFNVDLQFEGDWSAEDREAFEKTAEFLSDLIVDDIADVTYEGQRIDDILINVSQQSVDGSGGTLAYASIDALRTDGLLPVGADLVFDTSDMDRLQARGDWDAVVLHEMFHAVGFGIIWDEQGLVQNTGAQGGLRFTGANATAAYQNDAALSANDPFAYLGVPVETDGGPGTAGSHWDEAAFDREVMTGYLDRDSYVSTMTLASLEDLGYDTILNDIRSTNDAVGPLPIYPI